MNSEARSAIDKGHQKGKKYAASISPSTILKVREEFSNIDSRLVHTVVTVFQLVTGLPTHPMVVTVGGSLLGAGVLGEGSPVG